MLPRRVRLVVALIVLLVGASWNVAARAQSTALYFPATGHHLDDDYGFLSFWQAHGSTELLGAPVTEAFEADGRVVQYFERGRLEQQIDSATGAASVQNGRVGTEYAELLWRNFDLPSARAGSLLFEETGHTLREPFLNAWETGGGRDFFGAPISESLWEITEQGQRRVQYFERARLEIDQAMIGTPYEVVVSALGRELALLRGASLDPVPNRGAEVFGPPAAQAPQTTWLDAPPPPAPTPPPPPPPAPKPAAKPAVAPKAAPARAAAAPAPRAAHRGGTKSIVVNLSKQWLYAYEGGEIVFDAPVATGRDGMNTPAGNFSIYAKLKQQTMDGVTDGQYWVVPNVPNVMYIYGGVALHGTYWHNLFGSGARPSHGCVNMPLKSAAWLYDWAPVGTPVTVTY